MPGVRRTTQDRRNAPPIRARGLEPPGEVMSTMSAIRTVDHDCDHGFCGVCGAVWPCSRARRALLRLDRRL
jgi:hypothetical protein